MLSVLAVENYRSLRSLVVPLARLTVITGANGSGKSSLYRSMRLLAETCQGGLVASLAREGGLPSTLWAGPHVLSRAVRSGFQPVEGLRRQGPVHLRLGFASHDFGYAIDLGLPQPSSSAFRLDPEIKRECIWSGPVPRPSALLVERRGPVLRVTDADGAWRTVMEALPTFESMMTAYSDPRNAPETLVLRERVRSWRFYDHFRSDRDAPARRPQIGTYAPILDHDGANLAAALQTIREIGDASALDRAVYAAFPGATIEIAQSEGHFEVRMRQHGLLRPLRAAELSDGTLRYLLLVAALLTPRPPELLVFNEPEASLQPELIEPLSASITQRAGTAQIIVVSHNDQLVSHLRGVSDCSVIQLDKTLGETASRDEREIDRPRWSWPAR